MAMASSQDDTPKPPQQEEQLYLYQNIETGSTSKTTLTESQLCRILNPPASGDKIIIGNRAIHENTPIIGYNPTTNEYDKNGWKEMKSIPILREACRLWYYEAGEKGVKGPVSARALAQLWFDEDGAVGKDTRVWCSDMKDEWKRIEDIPELIKAMGAFQSCSVVVPSSTTDTNPVVVDASAMIYNEGNNDTGEDKGMDAEAAAELQAFLTGKTKQPTEEHHEEEDDEEGYESDGGTYYIKDKSTGHWIPSELYTPPPKHPPKPKEDEEEKPKRRKRKKPQFTAKNSKCWIYVENLPLDTSEEEVAKYFSKAGILDLDPRTQLPKIKLYKNSSGDLKGDASIGYARPESVAIALQILDESFFRTSSTSKLNVKRAKFEQKGEVYQPTSTNIPLVKRKIAKLAALQAVDWDENGENGRIAGGKKGLRIVVVKHLFSSGELDEEATQRLHTELVGMCSPFGTIEKITVFSKHPEGIAVIKFAQPMAASDAVDALHNHRFHTRKLEAMFWDGVTDYTSEKDYDKEEKEEMKRLDDFGHWLENQEVPKELMPRMAPT